MRVGVICEGPTDFCAIKAFFYDSLKCQDIESEFIPVQPAVDNTSPQGGWGNVLLWLQRNPPEVRTANLFGGGMFDGNLAVPPMDCLLIQLDSDVLEDTSFQKHVRNTYDHAVVSHQVPEDRAREIKKVLRQAWRESDMSQSDNHRHVAAPAVESTEAWCVAAFSSQLENFEQLSGSALTDRFMSALETTEGRTPQHSYARINKDITRREKFCEAHAKSSRRVAKGCFHFKQALERLCLLYLQAPAP